jgi:hypothetical protein
VPAQGTQPTRKSKRGRPRWRDSFEEDLAYQYSERGWSHREIYEVLNEMRQLLGRPPLEDVIGSGSGAAYYRCVRDRIDAGRANAVAASKRCKKLLKEDLAFAQRMARLFPMSDQGNPTRFFTRRKGGRKRALLPRAR